MKYSPEVPLLSVHVPKCAGTSFLEVLKIWFGNQLFMHYYDEVQKKWPARRNLMQLPSQSCIHGHFNHKRQFGVDDYYPGASQLITILRDPFDLHVSNYFYVKKRGEKAIRDGKPHEIIHRQWDLEAYLNHTPCSHILAFLPQNITLDNYKEILEQRFLYIGRSENMQGSIDELAALLGFETVEMPVANESSWDEPIPPNARERFRQDNPLATAIYDYAVSNHSQPL